MRLRRRKHFSLWGWRRSDVGYAFVPAEQAWAQRSAVVGTHDLARHIVTVESA